MAHVKTKRDQVIWAPREFRTALDRYSELLEVSRPDILRELTPFLEVAAKRAQKKAAEPPAPPAPVGLPAMLSEAEALAAGAE